MFFSPRNVRACVLKPSSSVVAARHTTEICPCPGAAPLVTHCDYALRPPTVVKRVRLATVQRRLVHTRPIRPPHPSSSVAMGCSQAAGAAQ